MSLAAVAVVVLCTVLCGCRSPGDHISRQRLLNGVERALSEPETLTYGVLAQQDDLIVKAHCSFRRDGSGDMKVFDKDDRLIYELITRFNQAGQSMHLRERDRVSGESLEYDVPQEQYYDESYDPPMFGSDPNFWACMVGMDWQSWLGPRSYFRPYLATKIKRGKLGVAERGGQELLLVQVPREGFTQEYYFDPQDHLLRLWRTVDDVDQRLTRNQTYVYCDQLSVAQCMSTLDSTFSRLVHSEGEVR
jgi:hypothetical protein